jgi:hypothetical protein
MKDGIIPRSLGTGVGSRRARKRFEEDQFAAVPFMIKEHLAQMAKGGAGEKEVNDKRIELMQEHLKNLQSDKEKISTRLKEQEAFLEDFFMKTADKIELEKFEIVPDRFAKAHGEMLEEIKTNTADTAENTKKEDDLATRLPFMLDESIVSLGDALLAIARRAVEEPDPFQEAQLSLGAAQLDAIENSSRRGIGRKL